MGNYTIAAYQLNPDRDGWKYQPVHNVGLLFLIELGIVGVILFWLTVISFFYYCLGLKNIRVMYYLLFFVFVPVMLFDHYLFSSYIGILLVVVYIASITRFLLLSTDNKDTPQSFHR